MITRAQRDAMIGPVCELYEPIDVLKPVAPGVWIVDGPALTLSALGVSVAFPTRMTIVRLDDGGLWCHSPTALSDDLRAQVDALGPVRHLVSPNLLHYLYIGQWQRAWPDAVAWASPGVRERAAAQGSDVRFDVDLSMSAPSDWDGQIAQEIFQGGRFIHEVAFFHGSSRTLILADLIENFELDRIQQRWRWLMRAAGVADPDGKAPIEMRWTFWGHRDEAQESRRRLIAWQPERIIIAHGRWYEQDGTAELARALRWLD
jgi:hypothetical protein